MQTDDIYIENINYIGFGEDGFQIGFNAFSPYYLSLEYDLDYVKPNGIGSFLENVDYKKGQSGEISLALWVYKTITKNLFGSSVHGQLGNTLPQEQFNTLMNQALKASFNVFLFEGKTPLENLWQEVTGRAEDERKQRVLESKKQELLRSSKPTKGCDVVWVSR